MMTEENEVRKKENPFAGVDEQDCPEQADAFILSFFGTEIIESHRRRYYLTNIKERSDEEEPVALPAHEINVWKIGVALGAYAQKHRREMPSWKFTYFISASGVLVEFFWVIAHCHPETDGKDIGIRLGGVYNVQLVTFTHTAPPGLTSLLKTLGKI